MRAVFAIRPYRLLFAAIVTSMLGDWLLGLVLGIWVKSLTGSNAAAGFTILCMALPTLIAPLGGLLVDRVRRKTYLIASNLVNALFLLPLVFVRDSGDVWIIYLVSLLMGVGAVADGPALGGLIKRLVPEEHLVEANSARQTAGQALRLFGPLAGAGLFAVAGGFAVALIDALSFVVAAGLIALLRIREERPERPEKPHLLKESAAGFRFILGANALRRAVIGMAMIAIGGGSVEVLSYAVTDQGLGKPPEFIAVMITCMSVTGLAGGMLAPRLVRRVGELATSGLCGLGFAVGFVLLAVPSVPVVLGAVALLGLVAPVMVIADTTLLQRVTPHELMGRVGAASEMAFTTPHMLSIAATAYLVTLFAHTTVLFVMAGVLALAGGYLYLGRRLSPPAARVSPSDRSSASASPR